VVKELLETVKGLKRIREDSDDDMSVESSVVPVKNQDGESEFKTLEEEIKNFVSEEFEEKRGARFLCNELYMIFRRSRGDGSEHEKNVFRHNARTHFMKRWPNCKESRFNKQRCYINVAVKTPPQ